MLTVTTVHTLSKSIIETILDEKFYNDDDNDNDNIIIWYDSATDLKHYAVRCLLCRDPFLIPSDILRKKNLAGKLTFFGDVKCTKCNNSHTITNSELSSDLSNYKGPFFKKH